MNETRNPSQKIAYFILVPRDKGQGVTTISKNLSHGDTKVNKGLFEGHSQSLRPAFTQLSQPSLQRSRVAFTLHVLISGIFRVI